MAGEDGLADEHRRSLYIALLKRLDDSRNEIRIAACDALSAFLAAAPADYCETNTGYLLTGFLVHMDDADPAVQEAVCEACCVGARKKPSQVRAAVEAVRHKHRSTKFADRVLEACC